MVAAGSSACVFVVVTTVVDTEATEGGIGSGIVFTRQGVGLLAGSATGLAVDAWIVGPYVDMLGIWGLVGSVGLTVEWPDVCLEGLCVPVGLLAFAVVAASV